MFEVADDALQLPAGDVQDWLELAPTERAPWLERGDLRASAALLLLEEAALRREELLARDELKRLLLGRQAKDKAGKIGRASGRERGCQDVEISVVAVSLKKKNKNKKKP